MYILECHKCVVIKNCITALLCTLQKCFDKIQPVILPHYTEYHGCLRDHITAMRSCSTYGDSLEVCAIAQLAKTQIHIVQQ